jgi:hypothetical protein
MRYNGLVNTPKKITKTLVRHWHEIGTPPQDGKFCVDFDIVVGFIMKMFETPKNTAEYVLNSQIVSGRVEMEKHPLDATRFVVYFRADSKLVQHNEPKRGDGDAI